MTANVTAINIMVFFPEDTDGTVRVHDAGCTHVQRDWREHGAPIKMFAQSHKGIERQLRTRGIRFSAMRVLPCALIPQGFWSYTPDGEPLKLLSTYVGARAATRRFFADVELGSVRPEHHADVYNIAE